MRRRSRLNPMPFVVLFGGAVAWAGSGGPGWLHTPFLFNRTASPADVRMTWVLRRVPCATTPEMLAATLGPSDLDDTRSVALDSGEVVTLNGPAPVGVCPDPAVNNPANPDQDCRAAILETAGAEPVLMVAPHNWHVDGGTYICSPGPSTKSRCAPKIRIAADGGDEALALVSRNGVLSFEVSEPDGRVGYSIRIGPVDPAAIAARTATPDGCRQARDAYRALAQSTACASDADCQALPGLSIPGEVSTCTLFVNQSVTPAQAMAVVSQWTAGQCASAGPPCLPPLGAVCRAGACAELCAGVPLPSCETSCDYYAKDPDGVCHTIFFDCGGSSEQCHPTCTTADLQRCVCKNNNTVVCEPRPLIDPTCPLPCRR
jgi:hypothetical protein